MQQNNSSRRGKSFRGSSSVLPIIISGAKVHTSASDLKNSGDWTHAHGVTSKGVQVNSLKFRTAGESTIFDDGGHLTSFASSEIEVASVALLKKLGYSISAPANSTT